jgi:tetratricopeptide (TPR) repeat protein
MDFTGSLLNRFKATMLKLDAWRAERRAASLFADFEVLQNRLRPYAPLDVHIPEWVEPELINLIGTGVMSTILEQAKENGAFQLNTGYYYSYLVEIEALESNLESLISVGEIALEQLPQQEVLLRARISAHMAEAHWRKNNYRESISYFEIAYKQDPSIIRRLQTSLPVFFAGDETDFSYSVERYLKRSPRFTYDANGLQLEIKSTPDLSICLKSRTGEVLSCYTLPATENQSSKWNAQELTRLFHANAFGLGYQISKAQRSILLGSSVILSSQSNRNLRTSQDNFLIR